MTEKWHCGAWKRNSIRRLAPKSFLVNENEGEDRRVGGLQNFDYDEGIEVTYLQEAGGAFIDLRQYVSDNDVGEDGTDTGATPWRNKKEMSFAGIALVTPNEDNGASIDIAIGGVLSWHACMDLNLNSIDISMSNCRDRWHRALDLRNPVDTEDRGVFRKLGNTSTSTSYQQQQDKAGDIYMETNVPAGDNGIDLEEIWEKVVPSTERSMGIIRRVGKDGKTVSMEMLRDTYAQTQSTSVHGQKKEEKEEEDAEAAAEAEDHSRVSLFIVCGHLWSFADCSGTTATATAAANATHVRSRFLTGRIEEQSQDTGTGALLIVNRRHEVSWTGNTDTLPQPQPVTSTVLERREARGVGVSSAVAPADIDLHAGLGFTLPGAREEWVYTDAGAGAVDRENILRCLKFEQRVGAQAVAVAVADADSDAEVVIDEAIARPCSPPAAYVASQSTFKKDREEWLAARAAGAGDQIRVVKARGGFAE